MQQLPPRVSLHDPHRVPPRVWIAFAAAAAAYLLPLIVFVDLADDVAEGEAFDFDRPVILWLHQHATEALTTAVRLVTELGGVVAVPIAASLVALILWLRGLRGDAALIATAVIGSTLLNGALKAIFRRQRPDFWQHLVSEDSYSFPSGHAMASMSLALAVCFVSWRLRARYVVVVAAALYVLFVGVSRIYLGVHYPSDVLAGWCVAAVWVLTVVAILRFASRKGRRQAVKSAAPRRPH